MMDKTVALINLILQVIINKVSANHLMISSEELKLPKIHQYDDFDECDADNGLYCITRSYIQPDNSSEVWRAIKVNPATFSQYLQHTFSIFSDKFLFDIS